MAYVALYRTYRPQKFSEVAGQRHIVTTLQNAIKLDKVSHAYLFSGPRGTGKTTIGRILAKAINCEKGVSIEPCCECEICKGITSGTIPDVIEIDAASNNGVDEIRDIRDKVKYLPSITRKKVYIIDEVHMLTTSAFNALLKTLEEPPAHVVFVMATTEPQKIPATILSRCQRFDFQGISVDDIKGNLVKVMKSENINITESALDIIAESCDGGMRDALSLLDQAISFSNDDVVDDNDVLSVSGNLGAKNLIELINCCKENNQEKILQTINTILNGSKEVPKVVSDLISFLRDILMYKTGFGNKSIYKNEEFIKLAATTENVLIYSWLQELNDVQNNIKFTNQKRAYLELGLLKMSDKEINDYTTLINKVQKLEAKIIELEKQPRTVVAQPSESVKETKKKVYDEDQYKNIVIEPKAIVNKEAFISSQEICEILNNSNKEAKASLIQALDTAVAKNPNEKVFGYFNNGQIVASSGEYAVFTLEEPASCNRLMKADNYDRFMEKLNREDNNLKGYYCIDSNTWKAISAAWLAQYKAGNQKPIITDIEIKVKKYIKGESKKDEMQDIGEALFGKDKINK